MSYLLTRTVFGGVKPHKGGFGLSPWLMTLRYRLYKELASNEFDGQLRMEWGHSRRSVGRFCLAIRIQEVWYIETYDFDSPPFFTSIWDKIFGTVSQHRTSKSKRGWKEGNPASKGRNIKFTPASGDFWSLSRKIHMTIYWELLFLFGDLLCLLRFYWVYTPEN